MPALRPVRPMSRHGAHTNASADAERAARRRACRCRSRRVTGRYRVVQDRHLDRGDRDTGEHADEQRLAALAPHREHQHQDERPEQVELLLHRERPHVLQQRRATRALEVREVAEDEEPVLDVEQRGDHLAAELVEHVGEEEDRVQRHHEEHGEERREQSTGPAVPEPLEADAVGLLVVGQQQARDQVAADHEEDVDAEEPAGDPALVGVVEQHRDDRERAQAVERRDVAESRRGVLGRDSFRCCHSGHLPIVARETAVRGGELAGQVALVTGASKGIGRAIAAVVRRCRAPR